MDRQGQIADRLSLLASYVMSRNAGNHEGLFDSRLNNPCPNGTGGDVVDQMVNAGGLLPNDRTHVLKRSGSYRAAAGQTAGAAGVFESGCRSRSSPPWRCVLGLEIGY